MTTTTDLKVRYLCHPHAEIPEVNILLKVEKVRLKLRENAKDNKVIYLTYGVVVSDFLPLVTGWSLWPFGVLAAVDDHVFRLDSTLNHALKNHSNDVINTTHIKTHT